jgi:hypothetical protein
MKNYIMLEAHAVGMYISDAQTLNRSKSKGSQWLCNKEMPYLPVLNWIQINADNQIKLCSGECVGKDIETLHDNHTLNRYTPDVMQNSKIDITTNDLLIGPVELALNFTDRTLTLTPASGLPKSYSALSLKSVPALQGKLVLLSIHTLNTGSSLNKEFGYGDLYLKTLRDKLTNRPDFASKELRSIYNYVIEQVIPNNDTLNMESDTYKVATMIVVDVEKYLSSSKYDTLVLTNKRLEITRADILKASLHDSMSDEYLRSKQSLDSLRNHGFSCYIIDNQSNLSERYINFAGKVMKVPSIVEPSRSEGFYLLSLDSNKNLQADDFTAIDKLGELKYLYKSMEEAATGASIREQYVDNLDMQKVAQSHEGLDLKAQHEKQMRELEMQTRKNTLEMEERHKRNLLEIESKRAELNAEEFKQKIDYEEMLRKIKVELENNKRETEASKFSFDKNRYQMDNNSLYVKRDYEERKYERDSSIETIKTVGAVAGLAAGAYVLFKKFG